MKKKKSLSHRLQFRVIGMAKIYAIRYTIRESTSTAILVYLQEELAKTGVLKYNLSDVSSVANGIEDPR